MAAPRRRINRRPGQQSFPPRAGVPPWGQYAQVGSPYAERPPNRYGRHCAARQAEAVWARIGGPFSLPLHELTPNLPSTSLADAAMGQVLQHLPGLSVRASQASGRVPGLMIRQQDQQAVGESNGLDWRGFRAVGLRFGNPH